MSKKNIVKNSKEQDQLLNKIYFVYKKKCEQNGLIMSLFIKEKLQQAISSGLMQNFQTSQQIGINHTRLLFQSLDDIKYKKLKKLRLWNAKIGDQGLRNISKYISNSNIQIQILDLLDNQISKLGCEFLGKTLLHPQIHLTQLKLDSNNIGSDGLKFLSYGLRTINTLDKLSLKYCNIDHTGSKYIQEIIANINTKLRSLKLTGNPLQNQGAYQVLRAVRTCGSMLEKVNISDVKMNLLDYHPEHGQSLESKIHTEFISILKNNICLIKFDFRFNLMHDYFAKDMLDVVQDAKNLKMIEFPLNVKYEFRDQLDTIIRGRNKKKGSKKKGKK